MLGDLGIIGAKPNDEISNFHLMLPNGWQKWHLLKANNLNSIFLYFEFNGFIKSEREKGRK